METILISGGTGLIGSHIGSRLQEKGYQVAVLSRQPKNHSSVHQYFWDWERNTIEKEAIETADYIIHLAGVNIGEKNWTAARKKLIIDSRVKTAELLFKSLRYSKGRLKGFISASAIGYYGAITSDHIFNESDPPANDFLGNTCRKWEQSADLFAQTGIRTVKLRTGIVLTKHDGALEKIIAPVKSGTGAALGSGRQYMPWIHIADLCEIYIKAIEDIRMNGAYNAVAPEHTTNSEFTRTLARILKKNVWLPNVPAVAMKLLFGEMADLLLKGSRVSSEKIKNAGFTFHFPELRTALVDLILSFTVEGITKPEIRHRTGNNH